MPSLRRSPASSHGCRSFLHLRGCQPSASSRLLRVSSADAGSARVAAGNPRRPEQPGTIRRHAWAVVRREWRRSRRDSAWIPGPAPRGACCCRPRRAGHSYRAADGAELPARIGTSDRSSANMHPIDSRESTHPGTRQTCLPTQQFDDHPASMSEPYRCWAAWADVPSKAPIFCQDAPAARAATTASAT